MKNVIIYLVVIGGFFSQACADESPSSLAISVSEAVVWHFRWDNCFHHKGTLDLDKGEFRYEFPTIRSLSQPCLELYWRLASYKKLGIILTGSYDFLKVGLSDDLGSEFPNIIYEKTFNLRLSFYSITTRFHLMMGRFSPYIGAGAGYADGSLRTSQYFGSAQGEKYLIEVRGDGGGGYIDFILGTLIRTSSETGLFIEAFHRRASDWKPFAEHEVFGDQNEITEMMKSIDRDVKRMHGLWIKIGFLFYLH